MPNNEVPTLLISAGVCKRNSLKPIGNHGIIGINSIYSSFIKDLAVGRERPVTKENEELAIERAKRSVRSTLIEPFSQIKFGIYVIGASLAFVVLIAAMFVYAFYQQYQHLMGIFNITDARDQLQLVTNDIFYSNAIKIGLMLFLYMAGMFFLVFKLTHRYYGPLVSIERFIDEIAKGKYKNRVKIRQRDELQRLANRLNEMATALEKRHGG
jgi:HAMP domain-containing protein